MTLTSSLIETCRSKLPAQVNDDAIAAARRCLLDSLAAAYAAYGEAPIEMLRGETTEGSAKGEASVIGYGDHVRPSDAALVNGTMISLQLFDDNQEQMRGHPSAPLWPAVLALAKRLPLVNGLVTPERLAAAGFGSRPYDTRHTPGANFGRIPGLRALAGSTLGLLGFGEIAREVAAMARPFGMELLYHKRARLTPREEREAGVAYSSFETLFARADYLSIHVPFSAETRDLVDVAALRRMKRGAFLINTSRAAIVNQQALLDAVASGHLAGVGLDVLYEEPAANDEPLLRYDNVILTPHVAGASRMNGLADLQDMLIGIWQGIRDP